MKIEPIEVSAVSEAARLIADSFMGTEAAGQKIFELIPFDKIAFDTAPAYLIKALLPRVGLCVFWGPPKCGKSFLVYDMLMHVALGWEYRGRKVRQGGVVYCALEGCAAFKNRVEAFRLARLAEDTSEVPFHLMASPLSLVADHAALIASIRAELGAIPPAVVAIDTLNRSLAGSESDDRDMAAYIKAADAIRDAFNCAVVIVHHCGHEATRPRGHSSLIGAVDAQIAVKRDTADNIVATVELMKDGDQGDVFTSKLQVVELGTDDDGDKITSCVIDHLEGFGPSQSINKMPARKPPPSQRLLFDCIREAIGEHGKDVRPFADGPTVKAVDDNFVRQIYYSRIAERALPDDDKEKLEERRRKAFNRAVHRALDAETLAAVQRDSIRILWLPNTCRTKISHPRDRDIRTGSYRTLSCPVPVSRLGLAMGRFGTFVPLVPICPGVPLKSSRGSYRIPSNSSAASVLASRRRERELQPSSA